MKKLFTNRHELILWTSAVLLFFFILGYTIYSVRFLAQRLGKVTNRVETPPEATRFDLKGAEELFKLKSPQSNAATTPSP